MSDKDFSAVDPELVAALAALPDLGDLCDDSLAEVREAVKGLPVVLGDDGAVTVRRVTIPQSDGAGSGGGLLYMPTAPAAGPRPALLNMHGGGYVAGSVAREDATMRQIVADFGCVALSVEYRLAPEFPYPAALTDCHEALAWLDREAEDLGIDRGRIGVRGVSAGGGLATALALYARDKGGASIAFLHLVYPMLDDRTGAHPVGGKFVWTADSNRYGWDALLRGQDRARPSPYAVPGRCDDVAGLPPVFIAVGGIDLFVGENIAFAGRLIDAGIATELHVYPGAYHGFAGVVGSGVGQAYARDSMDALRRAMRSA